MPYGQVRSPFGESDVLASLDTEDPLVCEVKVFDGEGRGKRHIASGVQQVAHYAEDYGKFEAYLVIVNLSGRQLELPTDDEYRTWPPCIDLAGVRVYLVVVRARRIASASRLGTARPVVVNRDDLVNPDVED